MLSLVQDPRMVMHNARRKPAGVVHDLPFGGAWEAKLLQNYSILGASGA
jgi:hypothetical protein